MDHEGTRGHGYRADRSFLSSKRCFGELPYLPERRREDSCADCGRICGRKHLSTVVKQRRSALSARRHARAAGSELEELAASGTYRTRPSRVIYLADERAISYAESILATVKETKLGVVVGEPSAGANGNINPLPVPARYVLIWTGTQVLRSNRGVHHTIGVTRRARPPKH